MILIKREETRMIAITRSGLGALACALLAIVAASARAADPVPASKPAASAAGVPRAAEANEATRAELGDEPATLRILNRDVVTLRASIGRLTPKLRVQRAEERLRELPASAIDDPLALVQARLGESNGVTFLLGGRPLFSVIESDVDLEARQGFDALVKQTQARLEGARTAWHEVHDDQRLLTGLVRTVLASLVFGILVWITLHVGRRAVTWMEKKRDVLAAHHPYIDWREIVGRLGVGAAHSTQWLVLFTLAYWWLYYVLASFALTTPLASSLGNWLFAKLWWIGENVLESLPGLATVALVLLVTRMAADLLRYFFDAVQRGRLRFPLFHPETASATRRIFTLLIWAIGAALAYPFLPGAGGEAFKGISLLLGVMISLGSAGLITHAMSGLVMVYSRSLRRGDFVDLNGVQGVVTEVAALAIKIIDVRNEEITIPNSVVVASPIRNFTRLGGSDGTLLTTKVSLGYDVPWRQVHALLIGAAGKTSGVRDAPAPYVYQRALSDFYVEYELFATLADPRQRVACLSELHAWILDEFNEHGVQIMSPHFFSQPAQPVIVGKEQWYSAPARKT
jgi:small-conductance mechanosensitive channel